MKVFLYFFICLPFFSGVTVSGLDATASTEEELGVVSLRGGWGGAAAEWSDEYGFGKKRSLKMTFPERNSGIWFTPRERDWTRYRQLVFTLYNPWNEEGMRRLSFRDSRGKKAIALPENISLPGGRLDVPRETRVTFKLDLTEPLLAGKVDFRNLTGVHIGSGTPETTFFLDQFELRTYEEVENEERRIYQAEVDAVRARLAKVEVPEGYSDLVEQALANLQAHLDQKTLPVPARWRPDVYRANELATVVEALESTRGGKRPIEVFTVSSMERVFRDETLPSRPLSLDGAGRERVSFQAVVVPRRALKGVTIEPSSLALKGGKKETIAIENIEVRPVAYVEVTDSFYYPSSRPGWWADPLLPPGKVDVAERIQPFWVTVSIPPGQASGVYEGQLTVKAEGEAESTLEYELEVWGFSLPQRASLQNVISFTYKPEDQEIRRRCYATLLDYRINPVNIYINGRVQMGYQPERSDLEFCLERGLNTLVLWNPQNTSGDFWYDFDDAYLERMITFISEYKSELQRLNAWDMSMVLGFDEITHREKNFAERATKGAGHLLEVMRENFPDLRLASIGGPPLVSTLTGPGNVWIPQTWVLQEKWRETLEAMRQEKGSEYFFYWVYSDPSFMLDLPSVAPRWLSWIAFKYGASGIGYYSSIRAPDFSIAPEGVDWPRSHFNIEGTNRIGRNGDGILVYPARDGSILPSIRMANTRDGIQDYEYLIMLKNLLEKQPASRGHEAAKVLLQLSDSFLTYQHYSHDPETLSRYRRKVALAIETLRN